MTKSIFLFGLHVSGSHLKKKPSRVKDGQFTVAAFIQKRSLNAYRYSNVFFFNLIVIKCFL